MKTSIYFAFLTICSFSITSYGQEVKVKKINRDKTFEEFYVLKANKESKHGNYVKFLKDFGDKYLYQYGTYSNNKKNGNWYNFYPFGGIREHVKYTDDKKHGLYQEFYDESDSNISINYKYDHFIVFGAGENKLIIDKSNLKISSEGVYDSNNKIGVWNYYSMDGELLHKYDHTTDKLIVNKVDSIHLEFPYLGSTVRFFNAYSYLTKYLGINLPARSTKIVFALDPKLEPLKFRIVEKQGDQFFIKKISNVLALIPEDWDKSAISSLADTIIFKVDIKNVGDIEQLQYNFYIE